MIRLATLASLGLLGVACGPQPEPVSPTEALPVIGDDSAASEAPYSAEEKAQSRGKLGGVWVSCYSTFLAEGEPTSALSRLAAACGKATGMRAVAPARRGEPQNEEDAVERFTFPARANGCYRVYAVGAAEVIDLDVALVDPAGKVAANDRSATRWPVVPARGPICAEAEGVYTVEVAVTRGRGPFALQVWSD
ncbi:MAG: hypothetical protein WKG00_22260 [Polyangiaceae bacterium]